MPFKSEKQRRYLWKNEPEVAREYAAKEKKLGGHKAYMKKMKMSKSQMEDMHRGYKRKP